MHSQLQNVYKHVHILHFAPLGLIAFRDVPRDSDSGSLPFFIPVHVVFVEGTHPGASGAAGDDSYGTQVLQHNEGNVKCPDWLQCHKSLSPACGHCQGSAVEGAQGWEPRVNIVQLLGNLLGMTQSPGKLMISKSVHVYNNDEIHEP